MVKAELGTKRTCPSCAARFYDLLKNPILCPKCGVSFIAAAILPSKGDIAQAPVAQPKPRDDVEPVDAEEPDAAGIEDVDLGEEAAEGEEDDTFLVEEEEDGGNVSGLLDSGPAEGKEEET